MISVVMSVYNSETYLHSAIKSILNQSYKDIEFIIIDDGSTDNSLKIIQEYAGNDDRIRIIKNDINIGLTKSLNKGLDIAVGEYIARQDADDISDEFRLDIQLHYLIKYKLDLVGCVAELIDDNDNKIGNIGKRMNSKQIKKLLKKGTNPMIHGSILFKSRKSILRYDPFFKYAQDYNFYLRNDFRLKNIMPLYLYKLRIHKKSITINKFKEQRFYLLCAKYYDKFMIYNTRSLVDNIGINEYMKYIKSINQDITDEYYLRIAWYYIFNDYNKTLAIETLNDCSNTYKKLTMLSAVYLPQSVLKYIHNIRKKFVFGK